MVQKKSVLKTVNKTLMNMNITMELIRWEIIGAEFRCCTYGSHFGTLSEMLVFPALHLIPKHVTVHSVLLGSCIYSS